MKDIVLARVDDRLIHGQVVTAWAVTTRATRIIIVDDGVANDSFNKRVIKLLAPAGTAVDIYTVEEGIQELLSEPKANERIIVLTKTPITFEALVEGGVKLEKVILGGMGLRDNRKPFVKNVSCSPEEIDSIKNMMNKGVKVIYQLVPEQRVIEISGLLEK
ncbi:MAG TPA: PTS mannose/fructose/sorbose transporter subunit IIB [Eubacteriaceae bacterium]|nr:PTS mannose/fructose/sorbose transporter subunit IIB [Eubacteriaceae bacterium]